MKLTADYIVVGSGLTGATVARCLVDAGREVVVLERRGEVGGNVRDTLDGVTRIRRHIYGPHYFRTNSNRLWDWAQRFGGFYPWAARVMTRIGGKLYRWPLILEDVDVNLREIAVGGYNRKMWGESVPREAIQRIDLSRQFDSNPRLKLHKHQGLPKAGYSAWVGRMLDGIKVYRGFDYLTRREDVTARRKLVFTGPLDEFYGFDLGKLEYRGQDRTTLRSAKRESLQPVPQVNFPESDPPYLRMIEWNYLAEQPDWSHGSLVTMEYPRDVTGEPDRYEYPVNTPVNSELYAKYADRVSADDKLVVCGRLGGFSYIDMDQAIAAAQVVARKLLEESP